MLGRAQFLISKGWNVLLADSRGRGDSGGGFTTFGARESGDLRRWLDWIEQRVATATANSNTTRDNRVGPLDGRDDRASCRC